MSGKGKDYVETNHDWPEVDETYNQNSKFILAERKKK